MLNCAFCWQCRRLSVQHGFGSSKITWPSLTKLVSYLTFKQVYWLINSSELFLSTLAQFCKNALRFQPQKTECGYALVDQYIKNIQWIHPKRYHRVELRRLYGVLLVVGWRLNIKQHCTGDKGRFGSVRNKGKLFYQAATNKALLL